MRLVFKVFLITIILLFFSLDNNILIKQGFIEEKYTITKVTNKFLISDASLNYIIDENLISFYFIILKYSEGKYSFPDKELKIIFEKYKEKLIYNNLNFKIKELTEIYKNLVISKNKSILDTIIDYYISYRTRYYELIKNINSEENFQKTDIIESLRNKNEINKKLLEEYKEFFKGSDYLVGGIVDDKVFDEIIKLDLLIDEFVNLNKNCLIEIYQELKKYIDKQLDIYCDIIVNNKLYFLLLDKIKIYYYFPMNFFLNVGNNAYYDEFSKIIIIPFYIKTNYLIDMMIFYIHESLHALYFEKLADELKNYAFSTFKTEIINLCLIENKLEYYLPYTVNSFAVNFIPILRLEDITNYKGFTKVYFENNDQFINKFIDYIFAEFYAYTLTNYIVNKIIKLNYKSTQQKHNYINFLPDKKFNFFKQYSNIKEIQDYLINNNNSTLLHKIIYNIYNKEYLFNLFKLFVLGHKYELEYIIKNFMTSF